jgi:hypothetical protein
MARDRARTAFVQREEEVFGQESEGSTARPSALEETG